MPHLLRRVAALTAISILGIALLAPLAARSSIDLPVDVPDPLLADPGVPSVVADRGSLSGRQATALLSAGHGAPESLTDVPARTPGDAGMQATLVPIATPAPVATPAPQRVVTYDGDTVWDDLAKCESGGNWAINTGNGYYGGLQFNYGTWHDYGGADFAEYPHEASRDEQIIVAERLRAKRGYQPWPACRAKLGLP